MFAAVLDLGIDLNVWPWIWLGMAVLFAIVELVVVGGSFIILPWALSAFFASILAFYDTPIEIQWAVFVFGGAIMFVFLYRWAQRFMQEHTMSPGVGADRLVGLTGIITVPVEPDDTDRKGRVMIDGEVWGVVDAAASYSIGSKVKVVAMKGTRVVIEPESSSTTGESAGAEEG